MGTMCEGYNTGREFAGGEVWKLLSTEDPSTWHYLASVV